MVAQGIQRRAHYTYITKNTGTEAWMPWAFCPCTRALLYMSSGPGIGAVPVCTAVCNARMLRELEGCHEREAVNDPQMQDLRKRSKRLNNTNDGELSEDMTKAVLIRRHSPGRQQELSTAATRQGGTGGDQPQAGPDICWTNCGSTKRKFFCSQTIRRNAAYE